MALMITDECINCDVCEPECPIDAIKPDTESGLEQWLEINTKFATLWPVITVKGTPPADAKDFEDVPNKFEKYFSEKPGSGT